MVKGQAAPGAPDLSADRGASDGPSDAGAEEDFEYEVVWEHALDESERQLLRRGAMAVRQRNAPRMPVEES